MGDGFLEGQALRRGRRWRHLGVQHADLGGQTIHALADLREAPGVRVLGSREERSVEARRY
jgi:hypothetical protein